MYYWMSYLINKLKSYILFTSKKFCAFEFYFASENNDGEKGGRRGGGGWGVLALPAHPLTPSVYNLVTKIGIVMKRLIVNGFPFLLLTCWYSAVKRVVGHIHLKMHVEHYCHIHFKAVFQKAVIPILSFVSSCSSVGNYQAVVAFFVQVLSRAQSTCLLPFSIGIFINLKNLIG